MRGKILIFVVVGVLVLLLGAGGAYWMLSSSKKAEPVARAAPKPTLFVSLEPMTVSVSEKSDYGLQSGGSYLQVGFQFATVKKAAVEKFKAILPAIRGNVLSLLLNVSPDVLSKQAAREKMKQQVLTEVNKTVAENDAEISKQAFDKAYITLFVTQPE